MLLMQRMCTKAATSAASERVFQSFAFSYISAPSAGASYICLAQRVEGLQDLVV